MSLLHYLLETLFQFSSLLTLNCTSSSVVLLYLYTINSCCLLLILENNSFLESLNEFYILPRFQDLIKNQEHYCVTRESLSARIFHLCLKYLFACVCAYSLWSHVIYWPFCQVGGAWVLTLEKGVYHQYKARGEKKFAKIESVTT